MKERSGGRGTDLKSQECFLEVLNLAPSEKFSRNANESIQLKFTVKFS